MDASPLTQKLIKDFSRLEKSSSQEISSAIVKTISLTNNFNRNRIIQRFFIENVIKKNLPSRDSSVILSQIKTSPQIATGSLTKEKEEELKNAINDFIASPEKISLKTLVFKVDRIISFPNEKDVFLFYAFNSLKKIIRIDSEKITDSEKNIVLYLAVQQAIFGFEEDLAKYNTSIITDESNEKIDLLSQTTLFKKVYSTCLNYKTPLLIIRSILRDNNKNTFLETKDIEEKIISAYHKIEEDRKNRAVRYIALSTIVIALLGFFFSFIFTVPLSLKIPFVLLPISLCSFLALEINSLSKKNVKKIVLETFRLLYKKEEEAHHIITLPKRRKNFYLFINLFYAIIFSVIFSFFFWSLSFLNLSTSSIVPFLFLIIFLFFTRLNAKRYLKDIYLLKKKESVLDIISEIIAFPLLKIRQIFILKKDSPWLVLLISSLKATNPLLREAIKNNISKAKERKEKLYEE